MFLFSLCFSFTLQHYTSVSHCSISLLAGGGSASTAAGEPRHSSGVRRQEVHLRVEVSRSDMCLCLEVSHHPVHAQTISRCEATALYCNKIIFTFITYICKNKQISLLQQFFRSICGVAIQTSSEFVRSCLMLLEQLLRLLAEVILR